MITRVKIENTKHSHWFGKSGDKKPTGDYPIGPYNGDKLLEMNTGKEYRFDMETGTWLAQPMSGSGSGSAGGGNIYGVSWDMTVSNKLTRTGASASFADPVPCVNGVGGSSPFDGLMPWAGMEIVEDELGGTLVAIPKFWYRITKVDGALSFEIADAATDGFYVSPAHMDRGDGKGERDVVYIGRYHCAGTTGQSVSGAAPLVNVTRADFRASFAAKCEAAGVTGYHMQDYAMWWTVRLLMLVEYATWDFQGAIGYGCGNGESAENTGSTDNMPYHTGTVQESITTYGVGVQYRYIEDMWANVADWVDGWALVVNEATGLADIYVSINPADYSETGGTVKVGTIDPNTVNGMISDWTVPTTPGFGWALTPCAASQEIETGTEYCADYCVFIGPALVSGGAFDGCDPVCGPFLLCGGPAESAGAGIGARLQKIP